MKSMIGKLVSKYERMPVQVKASFWFLICAFLQKGISVLSTPIFSRIMSTAEYGEYNVYMSWLDIVTIFVTLSMYYGFYSQGLVKFQKEQAQFSSAMQGLTLTLCLAWLGIYLLFNSFWNTIFSFTLPQGIAMFVMIWATSVFLFWSAEQRIQYKYKGLVLVTLVTSLAKALVGIFFVLNARNKIMARIVALTVVELVGYSGFFFIQMHRGKKFFSAKYWKYALLFSLPLIPHYLSSVVLNNADRIMIREMTSSDESGIYSLAYALSQIMTLFNTALLQTINPWIYQKINARQIKDISSVCYLTLIIVAIVNILLIALAPEAVALFAPAAYHDAIWVVPPIAMSVYFVYAYNLFANFEFYYEKTHFIMMASVAAALLNIVLNYIFIRFFGYRAAGYTTLVCYVVFAVAHYLFMNRICKDNCGGEYPFETGRLMQITGFFLAVGFVLLISYSYRFLRYGLLIFSLAVAIIQRGKIIESVQFLVSLRQQKGN